MKLFKKWKKARGEIDMTPFPEKRCKDFVPLIPSGHQKKTEELETVIKAVEEPEKEYSPKLVKIYEENFPGKHAVWRGKFTKQFTVWADKEDDSKD